MSLRNRRAHLALASFVAVSGLLAASCAADSSQGDDEGGGPVVLPEANPDLQGTITLGAVLPLTGVNATLGKDQQRGIDMAVAEINSENGVLGKKLVVKTEDSEGRADAAIQAARKLVNVDKAPVVFGEYSSGNTIPMQQYLESAGVVGVNPGSSSIEVRPTGDHQFSVIGLDDVAGRFAAEALHHNGYDSIAMLAPNNSYGSGIVDSVSSSFEELGGEVAASELYTEGQPDYREELGRLKDTDPDAYVLTTYGKDGTTINREAYELGMTDRPIFDVYMSQDVPDAQPEAVEGRIGMDVAAIGSSGKQYRDAYQKAFGEDFITSFNGFSYDAVKMVAEAIDKAGSTEPDAVRDALFEVGQSYVGATGKIQFDKDGQRLDQDYVLAEVHDGKIVPQ